MISRWILHLLLAFKIPLLLILIAGIIYLIAYRMRLWGFGPKKTVLPMTAAYGSQPSRIAEALILACLLTTVVIFGIIVRLFTDPLRIRRYYETQWTDFVDRTQTIDQAHKQF